MPEGSGVYSGGEGPCCVYSGGEGPCCVYSGGEGPCCRNDSYATQRLQAVLVKAMPSQGRRKQQESLYEYRLMSRTELGAIAQLLVKLAQLNVRAQGRSIASLVVARRQLLLSQARVQEPDKAPLLDAPISPGHTFGPAVEEMLQCSVKAREASQQLAKMWPSKPFQSRRPQERQWCRAPPQQQVQPRGSKTAPLGVSARSQPAFARSQRGGWRPRGGGRPCPCGSGQAPRERAQPKQP
ncbi:UNVERIFIED_CONTAM: hypothetical protein FKN15_074961 [Acipenser sinensis]